MSEHIETLRKHIEEGTLIRGAWRGTDARGQQTACLLAAMVPQCGIDESARACPAEVMPSWLAQLVPDINDKGSLAAWPGMVERFASLAARWHTLDAVAWQRVQFTWLGAVVREAARHTTEPAATTVCERVAVLCDGVVTTGVIDADSFALACSAARDVATSARAAAWAAAAWAAAWAAARAAAAWAAAWAAAAAVSPSEAWDRLTAALFEALEKELV